MANKQYQKIVNKPIFTFWPLIWEGYIQVQFGLRQFEVAYEFLQKVNRRGLNTSPLFFSLALKGS